jgi:hypothetical protein
MLKNLFYTIKSIFTQIKNIDFFLLVNITDSCLEYGVLYGSDHWSLLTLSLENQWYTHDGLITDFQQFYILLDRIINKIQKKYSIKCKKIIILFSIPGLQNINYHHQINGTNQQSPTVYYDETQWSIIHNCGKFYLLDGVIPVENIDHTTYETLDVYESYYAVNKLIKKQLLYQTDRLAVPQVTIQCPHYLLCGSLSNQWNKTVILVDIQMHQTTIAINNKKFSYGYFLWNKGVHLWIHNGIIQEELLQKFLNDLGDVIKMYPKAMVIIGGIKGKLFQWVSRLQKYHSNKIFFLNQGTNGPNNNIFFNLLKFYPDVFMEEVVEDGNILDGLENIVL